MTSLGSLGNLGLLLKKWGKLEEAEPLYREALEASRETFGAHHLETLISLGNLWNLLAEQGKLEDAKLLLQEVVQSFYHRGAWTAAFTHTDGHRLIEQHQLTAES